LSQLLSKSVDIDPIIKEILFFDEQTYQLQLKVPLAYDPFLFIQNPNMLFKFREALTARQLDPVLGTRQRTRGQFCRALLTAITLSPGVLSFLEQNLQLEENLNVMSALYEEKLMPEKANRLVQFATRKPTCRSEELPLPLA